MFAHSYCVVMFRPHCLSQVIDHGFDEVIDVRSPSEFEADHIPDAVNLPVLNCEERAEVGRIYSRESRFKAKRIGAAHAARNIAGHIENWLAERSGSYRPLIYCWRGGQRSEAMAEVLRRVGWRAEALEGGYRAYRRLVVAQLHDSEFPSRIVLLEGSTGTAKTAMLRALGKAGAQTIDLEQLANHRGSLFGSTGQKQPSQKAFESAIAEVAVRLDPTMPVAVEAESNRIGDLQIPPSLWNAMNRSPRIELRAPVKARVRHLLAEYAGLIADRQRRDKAIRKLAAFHSKERIAHWLCLSSTGEFEMLAQELMTHHYDARYKKHRERTAAKPELTVELPALSADELAVAAEHTVYAAGLRDRTVRR